MRPFGNPVSPSLREQVLAEVTRLVAAFPSSRELKAGEYVLEPADEVVLDVATITTGVGMVKLHVCRPGWAPPFEWLAEITSEIPGTDYLKHYLVREQDIVLAQRKELSVIDDEEAGLILADLEIAAQTLADLA